MWRPNDSRNTYNILCLFFHHFFYVLNIWPENRTRKKKQNEALLVLRLHFFPYKFDYMYELRTIQFRLYRFGLIQTKPVKPKLVWGFPNLNRTRRFPKPVWPNQLSRLSLNRLGNRFEQSHTELKEVNLGSSSLNRTEPNGRIGLVVRIRLETEHLLIPNCMEHN